jgi:hypothetical protein
MSNTPKHGITKLQIDDLPSENSFSNLAPSLNSYPTRPQINPQHSLQRSTPLYPPVQPQYYPQQQMVPPVQSVQPQYYPQQQMVPPVQPQYYSQQPQYYPQPVQPQYYPQQQMVPTIQSVQPQYYPPQQMVQPVQQQYHSQPQQPIYFSQHPQQIVNPVQPQYYPQLNKQFEIIPQSQTQSQNVGRTVNSPLEMQNNGSYLLNPKQKQQVENANKNVQPHRFPDLYNSQWKGAEVIEDVMENTPKLSNGLPKLETIGNMKQKIRNAIRDLYSNIVMTKTHDVPTHRLSVYKAVVEPLTSGPDVKYLVAIAPNTTFNVDIGTQLKLSEIDWINFQTRSTMNPEKEFNELHLQPQRYQVPQDNILHDRIKCVNETDTKWIYTSQNIPVQIEVLVQKENENFAQEGTIIGALELFQTILTL